MTPITDADRDLLIGILSAGSVTLDDADRLRDIAARVWFLFSVEAEIRDLRFT